MRHRSGLAAARRRDPGDRELQGLRFLGLLSHAGQAIGAGNAQTLEADRRRARSRSSARSPARCASAASRSRKSASARRRPRASSTTQPGVTEMRPGNYVFFDRTQVGLGRDARQCRCAMSVCDGRQPAGRRARHLRRRQQDADAQTACAASATTVGYGLVFPEPRRAASRSVDRDRAAVGGARGRAGAAGLPRCDRRSRPHPAESRLRRHEPRRRAAAGRWARHCRPHSGRRAGESLVEHW